MTTKRWVNKFYARKYFPSINQSTHIARIQKIMPRKECMVGVNTNTKSMYFLKARYYTFFNFSIMKTIPS